jgi:hypothetical protein
MRVRCSAGERFRITQRNQLKHGLWVADVTQLPADRNVPVPEDLRAVAQGLGSVIERLENHEIPATHMPLKPPYRLDDCGWVANRWSELLNLPSPMKQSLMQLENPLLRLELVGDILLKGEATA